MTLTFTVGDRFYEAAREWGDQRLEDAEDALESKVEQALLEIEHLVADAYEVEFTVDGREVTYEPTDDLAAFLERQAEKSGLAESEVLELHVDLFARVFLDDDGSGGGRPSNAPPR